MKTFSPEILAAADAKLAPIVAELARLPSAESERVRESMATAIADGDDMEVSQVIPRWRASVKARREQAEAAAQRTEAERIEMLKKEMLASPVLVEFLTVLSRELMHPDTRVETVRDATPDLSRLFKKLRP